MYLQKMDVQGFKSFASKTTLEFIGIATGKKKGITTIVGPNGSGKSNVADAIRWVLGEQSMKLLRGKKSEDVIFSGSEKKARASMAEVVLHLNNEEGKGDIDMAEIAIARRLYRDGESEYLINGQKVRLQDVQLLLAKANFGERHYAVIGQGMIDAMLTLSPEERRDFFDEATGVKPFQIKKDIALQKLRMTEENLSRARGLLAEIEPRMRSLARQVKRLEERDTLETELHGLQHAYYVSQWRELTTRITTTKTQLTAVETTRNEILTEVNALRTTFAGMEQKKTVSDAIMQLQKDYQVLLDEKSKMRLRQVELDGIMARARAQAEVSVPLPLTKIIQEIRLIQNQTERLGEKIRGVKSLEQAHALGTEIEKLAVRSHELAEALERPPKEQRDVPIDTAVLAERSAIEKRLATTEEELRDLQKEMESVRGSEQSEKSAVFAAQRQLEEKLAQVRTIEARVSDVRVELARQETRKETLEQEMIIELKERVEHVRSEATADGEGMHVDPHEAQNRMQKLKYQLEQIGGIDPDVQREHAETAERYTFLSTHTEDLDKAITDLEKIIVDLNRQIDEQFHDAFARLSKDFDRYFKTLFNGGTASLEKNRIEAPEPEEGSEELLVEKPRSVADLFESDRYTIDILANPPGKKVKSIAMLSGGERAMTSIALISAIISNNPSPFVVLDEVDAALDESNSIRFATIIDELSEKSQFVVITHNRYTMEKSAILYGVTMREDGTSQLLSVKMEDIKNKKTPVGTLTV